MKTTNNGIFSQCFRRGQWVRSYRQKRNYYVLNTFFENEHFQCWRFDLGLVVDLWTNMDLLLVDFFCNGSLRNQMAQLFNSIKTTNLIFFQQSDVLFWSHLIEKKIKREELGCEKLHCWKQRLAEYNCYFNSKK